MRSEAEVEDVPDTVPSVLLETLPPGHDVIILIWAILGDVELTSVSKQSIVLSHIINLCNNKQLNLLGCVTRFDVTSIGGVGVELLYQGVQRLLDHAVLRYDLVL